MSAPIENLFFLLSTGLSSSIFYCCAGVRTHDNGLVVNPSTFTDKNNIMLECQVSSKGGMGVKHISEDSVPLSKKDWSLI